MKKRYALLSIVFILTISCVGVIDCQCKTEDEYKKEADRLLDAGKYKNVAAMYEEMIKNYPETKAFYGYFVPVYLGVDYIMLGKLSDAESQMEEALKQYPDNRTRILGLFASVYFEKKMYDKSIALMEECIKLDPNYVDIRYTYASALKAKGMYGEAEKQCKIYINSYPDDYQGWWVLGNIFWYEKKYDDAIDAYKKELKLNPKKDEVLDRIMGAYKAKGDYGNVLWYAMQTVQERQRHGKRDWLRIGMGGLVSFIVSLIVVYLLSNKQNNKKYRLKQAALVSIGVFALGVIGDIILPFLTVVLALLTLPLSFMFYTLLCRYICNVSWKKSLIMVSAYVAISVVIGVAISCLMWQGWLPKS